MKKKVLLSSAALLAAVSLAACKIIATALVRQIQLSTRRSCKEKVTLKLAALESGYGAEMWPAIIKAMKRQIQTLKVELTQDKEIEDKITPQMKAGDYPDIVMLALGRKKAFTRNIN